MSSSPPPDFNPRTQTFYLIGEDGETQVPVDITMVRQFLREDYGACINYGAQLGACFMVMVIMVAMTPRLKLVKLSQWVQLCALVVAVIRQSLLCSWFLSGWNDFYAVWAMDYSAVTHGEELQAIVTEVISVIAAILCQFVLAIQAWAMVNLLARPWKWTVFALSVGLSLLVIASRLATGISRIQQMITLVTGPIPSDPVYRISQGVSIVWYCVVFNSKLVIHLVRHRGILPSRRGLSAIEILVITNGILMFIPVVFTGMNFANWNTFDVSNLAQTSVFIFLPLGTIIAQRISTKDAYWTQSDWTKLTKGGSSGGASSSGGRGASSPNKLLGSPAGSVPSARFGGAGCGTSAHVEASRMHPARGDAIDDEIRRIDSDDVEKGGVRVNQEFERREERV